MKLSIVIVNYNVKYFLEQCLASVSHAIDGLQAEVFVVDNNSVDGSVRMLSEKFPWVKTIANSENLGFSKANNQAIRMCKGEYILLLNPDTVVEDDSFHNVVNFADEHPDAGGIGVKMVDGKGKFLPESKRGLPTPAVAFYKIFGLSKLFPRSKRFGKYHLSYLDKEKTHKVDVLSGAFMFLRKKALDDAGLLDETFFMYGEDIDLSYRLTKAGYNNYYFHGTRIIHYKGESTKKSSINYVFIFYKAMIIFVQKHFSKKNARMFAFLINLAIYLRAGLAIFARFVRKASLPMMDAAILFGGIYLIKGYWEKAVIFPDGGTYPQEFITIAVPAYILSWLFSVFISGGYDRPIRPGKIIQGFAIGTIFILVVYALLDETHRFSRALILLGAAWGMLSFLITRLILRLSLPKVYPFFSYKKKRFVVVGDAEEGKRVTELLNNTHTSPGYIGLASVDKEGMSDGDFIGHLAQLPEIIEIFKIDEIVFCAKNITAADIIDKMTELGKMAVDFKIAQPESMFLIGSNSINTQGDLYVIDMNTINKSSNKRNKRFLDMAVSLFFLAFIIPFVFIARKPLGFLRNIILVFFGFRSWVGYAVSEQYDISKLPKIRKGILNPTDGLRTRDFNEKVMHQLNQMYARNYSPRHDAGIIWKGIREIGR